MKLPIDLRGQKVTVEAEIIDGRLWMKYKDDTFVFDTAEEPARKRKSAAQKGNSNIMAPMPGKITKIFCQVGQEIKRSQAVLVMEAMKMEYTLKAEADCVIRQVGCQIGDQVKLGQLLVELKETPSMPKNEK